MADSEKQQMIADLARQVVADVAPQEMSLFRPLSQAYFKDPSKTLKGGGGADRMLGFGGMSAVAALKTPLILQSSQIALDYVFNGFMNHVGSEIDRIQSWLNDVKARPSVASGTAISTDANSSASTVLDQVHNVVLDQLRQMNVSSDQCDQIASKVCSMLASGKIAEDVLAREQQLHQQVQELKIEIDQVKKAREVEQIVGSDYFTDICQRAAALRKQAAKV